MAGKPVVLTQGTYIEWAGALYKRQKDTNTVVVCIAEPGTELTDKGWSIYQAFDDSDTTRITWAKNNGIATHEFLFKASEWDTLSFA